MDKITRIAHDHGLYVIEDAAQAVDTKYKSQYSGTIGDAGAFSFHDTKNFVAGEGGALIINNPEWIERAEIIREKGTNRSQFIKGQVDKYTWVDTGSSYVPSDMLAAVLLAQLESIDTINVKRQTAADLYRKGLKPLEDSGFFKLPIIPPECTSNNHMFSLYCESPSIRNKLLIALNSAQIQAVFHYIPLHNSPFAINNGLFEKTLPVTEHVSDCLLRLPMYPGLKSVEIERICKVIQDALF
jgi:dTDP-4-amino-4,6-dideoxygalactose transaminase